VTLEFGQLTLSIVREVVFYESGWLRLSFETLMTRLLQICPQYVSVISVGLLSRYAPAVPGARAAFESELPKAAQIAPKSIATCNIKLNSGCRRTSLEVNLSNLMRSWDSASETEAVVILFRQSSYVETADLDQIGNHW
jgi:hypothetical protein